MEEDNTDKEFNEAVQAVVEQEAVELGVEEETTVYYYVGNKLVLAESVPVSSYKPKESRQEIREYVDNQRLLQQQAAVSVEAQQSAPSAVELEPI